MSTLTAVGTVEGSFWRPSLGPTSTSVTSRGRPRLLPLLKCLELERLAACGEVLTTTPPRKDDTTNWYSLRGLARQLIFVMCAKNGLSVTKWIFARPAFWRVCWVGGLFRSALMHTPHVLGIILKHPASTWNPSSAPLSLHR